MDSYCNDTLDPMPHKGFPLITVHSRRHRAEPSISASAELPALSCTVGVKPLALIKRH